MSTQRQFFQQYLAPTSPAPLMLEFVRAEGIHLFDKEGNAWMDMISGISVSNLGHGQPSVVEAVQRQSALYMHQMVYGEYVISPQVELAQTLASMLPAELQCFYFVNSGAEAIEGAMKLAKRFTGRKKIIAFRNAYHGSSQGALSLMSDTYFTEAYQPLLPNIEFITYNNLSELSNIDEETAAVFVELVQAEAGVYLAQPDFLRALSKTCKEKGVLLVVDECQTGLGRCGPLFAFMDTDIQPDILISAKALGGGMPMGAFISSTEIMQVLSHDPVLGHITTFGGHPVCCAAATAALKYWQNNIRPEETEAKGQQLELALSNPKIKEIRRKGLMLSLDFGDEKSCRKVIDAAMNKHLISDWFLFAPHCLRLAPPLTISPAEIDEAARRIQQSINE